MSALSDISPAEVAKAWLGNARSWAHKRTYARNISYAAQLAMAAALVDLADTQRQILELMKDFSTTVDP